MCLLLAAHRVHPRYDLAVAANRDERHSRPSAAMHFWSHPPGLLAGRDLEGGGTWLGTAADGRFAAVTNFHEPARTAQPGTPSRGRLVTDYFAGRLGAAQYVDQLRHSADEFAGFSLLLADRDELWYASNRMAGFAQRLGPGIYGLSNERLDTPWPKTLRARERMARWVDSGASDLVALRELLLDDVPDTGSGLPWPASSGPFVRGEEFGTRSVTWLARDAHRLQVAEENFAPLGLSTGMAQFSVDLG